MSQFILCKGINQKDYNSDATVIKYPFEDKYLFEASNYFWEKNTQVFSVVNYNTYQVDSYFTDAQKQILENEECFNNTNLYKLLYAIICEIDELVLWYSDYKEDIPCVSDIDEFFKIVEEELLSPSCEVYVKYKR